MIVKHEGFTISGITGGASATIQEKGSEDGYTEITLTKVDGSYDLAGLIEFSQELDGIISYARSVDQVNERTREQ